MTQVQTWSTDTVQPAERFAAWTTKMRSLHLDWDLTTPSPQDYSATIRYRRTGNVRLAEVGCDAFDGHRQALPQDPPIVGVQLQVEGTLTCTYRNQEFTLHPGDLFVWNSSDAGAFSTSAHHRQLSLLIPAPRAPKSVATAPELTYPLAAQQGSGALSLAADQLRALIRELDQLNDDAVNRAVTGLLDLVDAGIAPVSDADAGQRTELLADIQQYVLERLGDPELNVNSIAAAHWISVRSLHSIFSESGTTVARWVRQQRLERAHRDLSNATTSTTVTEIAFRWGFSDTSHFSRVFKREFGVSPTDVMPH